MKNKKLKQVAVIDDIVGFGKCSLSIAIPTLCAAGIEVCSGVSAVYTTHTPIKGYEKLETNPILESTIKSWYNLNLKFDAIYIGALSSKDQVYMTMQLFADHSSAIKIVDPILGDFGNFYDESFKTLLPHIKKLVLAADIITPNMTEAMLLTGAKTNDPHELLMALKALGIKSILLKGYISQNNISNYLMDNNENISIHTGKYFDKTIHGAGDFFIMSALAHYLKNNDLKKAIDYSTKIVSDAVKFTISQDNFENKGICFEPYLNELISI